MTKRKANTAAPESRPVRNKKTVEEPVEAEPKATSKASKAAPAPKGKGKKAEPASERPKDSEVKAVEALIEQIDFEPIIIRLEAKYGWGEEHLCWAIQEYKRFLTIRKFHDDINASPEVDTVWSEHIIHTQAYLDDVTRIFGQFLHHTPICPDDDIEVAQKIADRTAKLYQDFYNEPLVFLYEGSDDEGCGHCEDSECDDSQCGEDDGEDDDGPGPDAEDAEDAEDAPEDEPAE
eukprot:TRINITY_DN38_c0_g1_i1.p2 TRINITY_DN38_c0_g1~~TRINITY_DN38_c0_g1_i1.p2  ORF type:complete len:234 (-),score=90.12 TRINITY_DN38_c0_g1_i1:351-1052(-)